MSKPQVLVDNQGGIGFVPCQQVAQQVEAWMRSGARMLPDNVLRDEHMTEVWFAAIEARENEVQFAR